MRLVAATPEMIRAEIDDHAHLSELLGAEIPADWPPELIRDALPWFLEQLEARAENFGWMAWYGIAEDETVSQPSLVTSGGYTGPPVDGSAEIGYSASPSFYLRGYTGEMMAALVRRAFEHTDVSQLVADVREENTPSLRLLARLGFRMQGPALEPEHLHFILEKGNWIDKPD